MGIVSAAAAGVCPPSARSVDLLAHALALAAASWPSAAHVQGTNQCALKGAAAQASHRIAACACTSSCIVILNATSYGATCRYTCCRERERCATRAPPMSYVSPPPEHIRRNHRNIARLYTFAVLQQVLASIESIL